MSTKSSLHGSLAGTTKAAALVAVSLGIILALPQLHSEERSLDRFSLAVQQSGIPSIAHLTVKPFEVNGETAEEIRAELNAKGPLDVQRYHRDAFTRWYVKWRWNFSAQGKADIKSTQVSYQISLHLPKWTPSDGTSQALITQWDRFFANLLKHERRHIDFVLEHYEAVSENIRKAAQQSPDLTAAEANAIGEEVLARIRSLDAHYDKVSAHGKNEGVLFP